MRRANQATIYFSFRSPYSWIAIHRLQEAGICPGGEVRFVPFWEPNAAWQARLRGVRKEFPYVPMSKDKHLYILGDIKRLAARQGLKLSWPLDNNPDWSVPHLAYLAAARLGKAQEFVQQVYAMRWEQGLDIWNWDAMANVAGALGLNKREFLDLAGSEAVEQEGFDALCAIVKDGVFGVPFFLVGREKFWGADRLDDFLVARGGPVTRAWADLPIPAVTPELPAGLALSSFIGDHAGGCG